MDLGTAMDNSPTFLGPTGLIRKHEFVGVMVQCLRSLGYINSASCLELESGVSYESAEFELLQLQILEGNWDGCRKKIDSMTSLTDDVKSSAVFLVLDHCLQECLNCGDDTSALDLLRKNVSALKLGAENVRSLTYNILCPKEREFGNSDTEAIHELRKKLLIELEKLLPPPITIPERRLEHLIESVLVDQLDSCIYHNSSNSITLYKDHYCGRDQIPTETVQILTAHRHEVWFVQFSNNGEYLASSSCDYTTIIWQVLEDGEMSMIHTLQGHQSPVSFVSWSPDDTNLLTCGNSEVLKLWDVETGTCRHTFGDPNFIISACAWFPDSNQLVCGSSNPAKGVCIFDTDGKQIKVWKGSRIPKIMDLAVTPDGENLVIVFSNQKIRILNLETNIERVISETHQIASLSISRDSKFFIVNLNNREIHLWDISGELDHPLKYLGHEQQNYVIRSCFGGCNGSFIASGSENSKVYIWNRRNSRPIEELSGHSKTVNCVTWNPCRHQMLASASDDHTVRIWGPSLFKTI